MKRSPAIIYVLSGILSFSCSQSQEQTSRITGKLQEAYCNEISGIVASHINKGVFYVHNDSGDTSRVFAINNEGKVMATCYFAGEPALMFGVKDCEAIGYGPGPEIGKSYIYLGDIGDNAQQRPYVSIYRFEDPPGLQPVMQIERQVAFLKYPDGPRDAETLMVDPVHHLLYILSKRQDTIGIYSTTLNFSNGDTITFSRKASLFIEDTSPGKWIVAGDISSDGRQILIKSQVRVYHWNRNGTEAIEQTLTRKPTTLPYTIETQGEAICFTPDGKGYYTVGEGRDAAIYYYSIRGL